MFINVAAVKRKILKRLKLKWPNWFVDRVSGVFIDQIDRAVERIIGEAIEESQPTNLQTFTGKPVADDDEGAT